MAYDKFLATRIRAALTIFPKAISEQLSEKAMFGGLAFLYRGKMTIGIVKNDLMVRVLDAKMEAVLKRRHVRPMDFTKKPMKESIFVAPQGFITEEELQEYIELGIEHAVAKFN
ncbi:MAG: TfoX/Sxy family protein [Muriicola sp.]|nr:TfoX/Sxy family protein [Muriicola sp.]